MRNILKLACVLFCIVGLVPNLMGCNKQNKTEEKKAMSLDEFKAKLVVGMTTKEVDAALGFRCGNYFYLDKHRQQLICTYRNEIRLPGRDDTIGNVYIYFQSGRYQLTCTQDEYTARFMQK